MGTESGQAHPRLTGLTGLTDTEMEAKLREQPYAFSFFQAVRLLERLNPNSEPVGTFVPPSSEAVHFRASASTAFPASEIQSLDWPEDGPSQMEVNFMGLTGPLGVLPLYYSELVQARTREKDTGLKDFFDIFNHRMISLFYRAWRKYRFTVGYEREERDQLSLQLLSLVGLGTPGLQERQPVPDDLFLYYAGLLMSRGRSATLLKQLLADYFAVDVKIEEFAGSWQKLDPGMQTCIGDEMEDSGRLGFGAIVGDEVWQDESTVRIKMGPLTLEQYLEFLPGGSAHKILCALTRFFSGDALDFEVQLILRRDEVPSCELGSEGLAAPRLGWVTWMKSIPFGREAEDTILRL